MNEIVRVRIAWFAPGDLCYENMLINPDGLVSLSQPDLDVEAHYRLDKSWVLNAANNGLLSEIDVRIVHPITLYTFDLFPETCLEDEVQNGGWSVFESYLKEIDALGRERQRLRLERARDPMCGLPSHWASFLTVWSCTTSRDEWTGECDSEFDLLGVLDLKKAVLS